MVLDQDPKGIRIQQLHGSGSIFQIWIRNHTGKIGKTRLEKMHRLYSELFSMPLFLHSKKNSGQNC